MNIWRSKEVNYDVFMLFLAFFIITIASNFFESNFGVASDLYWLLLLLACVNPKCYNAGGTLLAAPESSAPIRPPASRTALSQDV